jgi:hypothetical protein
MIDDKEIITENIIILHPDIEKLKVEVEKLRTELSMLVLEKDQLLLVECKNIEMVYMLSVGGLEYRAYEIECAVLRQKRKIELIQAKLNRQERVNPAEIDEILDIEFEKYQDKLEKQLNRLNDALERGKAKELSKDDTQELRRLYRIIVKALHPDLHPNQSEGKMELFYHAVKAYEQGDLKAMEIISQTLSKDLAPDDEAGNQVFLMKEKKRLVELLESVKARIATIKTEYPYTMKAFVANTEKITERKAELEKLIKHLEEVMGSYTKRITELLEKTCKGKWHG